MKRTASALVAILFLWMPCASATTLLQMDLDDLTGESHTIVYGKIVASRVEWNRPRTLIFTVYTVEPFEYLKGPLGPVFELVEPGGEIDGLRLNVPGVPVFQAGEEAVLFVWTDSQGQHQVSGFEQGALGVRTDPQTHLKSVSRSLRLGSARENGLLQHSAPVTSAVLPEFLNQIRVSAARTRAAAPKQ